MLAFIVLIANLQPQKITILLSKCSSPNCSGWRTIWKDTFNCLIYHNSTRYQMRKWIAIMNRNHSWRSTTSKLWHDNRTYRHSINFKPSWMVQGSIWRHNFYCGHPFLHSLWFSIFFCYVFPTVATLRSKMIPIFPCDCQCWTQFLPFWNITSHIHPWFYICIDYFDNRQRTLFYSCQCGASKCKFVFVLSKDWEQLFIVSILKRHLTTLNSVMTASHCSERARPPNTHTHTFHVLMAKEVSISVAFHAIDTPFFILYASMCCMLHALYICIILIKYILAPLSSL